MTSLRVLVATEQVRRRVPGGVGRAAVELVRACSPELGADLTLWASRPVHGVAGDPLAVLGWPVRSSRLPSQLLVAGWDLGLVSAPRGFDVVHAVSLAAPPARGQRVARRGVARESPKVTLTVHDLAWRRHPGSTTRRGYRWHEAALLRAITRCDRLIAPSASVGAELRAAGVPDSHVSVIPWGCDHLPSADSAGAAGILERHGIRGPFLLTVGTLEPRKNLPRICDAYRRARGSLPQPWPLLVVGPTGWGHPRRSLGNPVDGVILSGPVPDAVLAGLYERARILAYFPLEEGYGLPPVEALERNLPVAASTRVPSVSTEAWPEPVAVLADPFDVDAMASALVRAAGDEALRGRLVKSGAAMASTLTWRATAEAYVAEWRCLAGSA